MEKKVLIIDDDQLLCATLTDALTNKGITVTCMQDGRSGLGAALAIKPDLITLDWNMPGADGEWFLDAIRKDPWGKSANIMLITGNGDDIETVNKAMQGSVDYIFYKGDTDISKLTEEILGRLSGNDVVR